MPSPSEHQNGVPKPRGESGAALLDAVWERFNATRTWPTFDEIDRELDRRGIEFEKASAEVPSELVTGLERRGLLPRDDQPIGLTMGGCANLRGAGNYVRAYLGMVALAVKVEAQWISSEGQRPSFSRDDAAREVPGIPPGTRGTNLLDQVFMMMDREPWVHGWNGPPEGAPWVIRVGREIRRFHFVKTIDEYWNQRSALMSPAGAESAVDAVEVRAADASDVLPASTTVGDLHVDLAEAGRMFHSGHLAQAAGEALQAVDARTKALAERVGAVPDAKRNGRKLMTYAFNPNDGGPVLDVTYRDTAFDQNEQLGFMYLFMGAISALRNPLVHKSYQPDDPTEVWEILTTASLLMRCLDRAEKRLLPYTA
jgi:uncharacterized protein (TIGR02391 family)